MNQTELQQRRDRQLTKAYDGEGAKQFRHPSEILESEDERELLSEFAECLAPVFAYIGKGRLGHTMDQRSWVVLYCMSPDYVRGETIAGAAARFGVGAPALQKLINEFRSAVPGLRSPHQKSARTVEKMSRAATARASAHPPG